MKSLAYWFADNLPWTRKAFGPVWRWGRAIAWKVRQTLLSNMPVRVRFNSGVIGMEPQGQIAMMIWGSQFEHDQRDFVSRFLQPGMNFINIGANAGLYTLMASKLVGPAGTVLAFEPSTENFDRLMRNIGSNGCENVAVAKLALSDFRGNLGLCFDASLPEADGHYYVEKLQPGSEARNVVEAVPCETLDAYRAAANAGEIKPVDMIVIDVEGAELDVFRGSRDTFAKSPNLVIYLEATQRVEEVDAFLKSYGFKFYTWNARQRCLSEVPITRGSWIAMRNPGSFHLCGAA